MVSITQINKLNDNTLSGLTNLLEDSVRGGASVGFMLPFDESMAKDYWLSIKDKLNTDTTLWVTTENNQVIACVQLSLCLKSNGAHRAEVQKLLVHSSHRGKKIAAKLMAALEAYAKGRQITLLVLDTQSGSAAENMYLHLGWHKVGVIPDYAANPHGILMPTTCFYKSL